MSQDSSSGVRPRVKYKLMSCLVFLSSHIHYGWSSHLIISKETSFGVIFHFKFRAAVQAGHRQAIKWLHEVQVKDRG
jgi:hypothetical protein